MVWRTRGHQVIHTLHTLQLFIIEIKTVRTDGVQGHPAEAREELADRRLARARLAHQQHRLRVREAAANEAVVGLFVGGVYTCECAWIDPSVEYTDPLPLKQNHVLNAPHEPREGRGDGHPAQRLAGGRQALRVFLFLF